MTEERDPPAQPTPVGDHEVGYKKPPQDKQFKKGHSGNPRGRPKGSTNYRTVIRTILDQKVWVTENGKPKKISKFSAVMTQLVNKAAAGDMRAMEAVIKLIPWLPPEVQDRILEVIIQG